MIIALILLGRLLESRAKSNTSTAIRKLIGLQPKEVIRILEDGTEQVIPIKAVQPGDILLVKPGDSGRRHSRKRRIVHRREHDYRRTGTCRESDRYTCLYRYDQSEREF